MLCSIIVLKSNDMMLIFCKHPLLRVRVIFSDRKVNTILISTQSLLRLNFVFIQRGKIIAQ